MIEIFYLIFFLLIALALGGKIFTLIKVRFQNYLEKSVFSLALGTVVLTYITFFLGIFGLLYKFVLIPILISIFILLVKDIRYNAQFCFKTIKNINIKKFIKNYKFDFFSIVAAFIVTFILLNFIISFSPPWHFDVVAYHLAIQKIYMKFHQIVYIPYIFYSNLPSLVDTIYLNGFLLHSGILSNLIAYALSIAFLFAIFSFCKRFFNFRIALLASLIFYSSPMVTGLTSTAHIDVQFALFVFLSFYSLFVYFSLKDRKWLIVASIFAGFGASSKIFGAVAVIGVLIMLVINLLSRLRKNDIGYANAFLEIIIFCSIVLIVTTPWLLKNYFFTGNPVWPAFNEIFNGKYWDETHQEKLSKMINLRKISVANYLRLPWDIHTQMGKNINNIDENESIGPYFLTFLPLYFLLKKKNKIINLFFILIFVYITMWFFLSYMLRYIIFAMPLVAIISSYVIVDLLNNKYLSSILKILLVVTFSFNLMIWIGGNAKELPVAIGLESHDSFYSKYPGQIYKASKFINNNLPKDAKILLFRDTRGFFLEREYMWADPLYQMVIDYSKINNEDDFYKELKKLEITHILVNTELEWHGIISSDLRYNKRILGIADNFLRKYTTNLYNEGGILVNEVKK